MVQIAAVQAPYWSNPPFLIFDIRERPNVRN